MASSKKPSVRSMLDFTSNDNGMVQVQAPVTSTSQFNYSSNYTKSDWNDEDQSPEARRAAEKKEEQDDLNYVSEHVELERLQIDRLNEKRRNGGGGGRGGREWHSRDRDGMGPGPVGRGRGRGRGGRPPDHHSGNNNQNPALFSHRGGRGQKFQQGNRDRGAGRGSGVSSVNSWREQTPEKSVFGAMPDHRVSDADVFMKYDFTQHAYNTSNLVINKVQPEILLNLQHHQIMTIQGFTGCGKTTQVPQFILDHAVEHQIGCRIAVTQPRRIAAISVAGRVAAERKWNIGGIVGYQVGMARQITDDSRLIYMTTGVLLQMLIAKKSLSEWTHIIIDEVHERDLETDLLLLVIKKLMVDNYDTRTKIILMSATLEPEKFAEYFPLWETDTLVSKSKNISVDLPNQYPITEKYLEDSAEVAGFDNFDMAGLEEPKIHQECYQIATHIIEGLDQEEQMGSSGDSDKRTLGAVLVFLPGLLEIETMLKILQEVNISRASDGKEAHNYVVLPLHSSITNDEQQRVFVPAKTGFRKIILATNIAESSITVPDVKYVIDFCLTKNLSCDPATNYTCLRLEWASKNQCTQRRGRCGRVAAGVVYRMVTKKFYNTLQQEACPEMLRSSLESVVLQVKLLDMGPPKAVLALSADPPPESKIRRAVANLKEIGALTIMTDGENYDAFDGNLTFVGRVLSRLPIDIRFGRLILLGHAFDCLEEAVIIAAGLSVKSPFAYPYSKRLDAYLSKLSWSASSFSDCLALLNVYTDWNNKKSRGELRPFHEERAWARTHFVQTTSLREMKVLIEELYKRLRMCSIELMPCPIRRSSEEQQLLLKLVIAGAFYPNYFTRPKPNARDYNKEVQRELSGHDPFTSVVFQGFPMEQPGDLYKKTIGNAVTYQTCIPKLNFNGSRVVATFDARGNFVGPICRAVYRAVKMRQLRVPVTFPTPSREEAYNMLAEKTRLLNGINIVPCPSQTPMPGLRVKRVQANVTHFDSPTEFFVVFKSDEAYLNKIREVLNGNDVRLVLETLKRDECQPGQFCIVSIKGQNHRARIDANKDTCESVLVYLLDSGASLWVRRESAFSISRDLFQQGIQFIPALAVECRLKQIRPSLRTGYVWCDEVSTEFRKHSNMNNIHIEIHSVVQSIIYCDVISSEDKATSLVQLLLDKRFAEKCDEPKPSFENSFVRQKVQALRENEPYPDELPHEKKQAKEQEDPEKLMDAPVIKKDLQNMATLRGPFSPLEMHFNSLCYSAHLKQVITDGSSVNSVVLDQDPFNSVAQLMIAANVAVAHRSGHILARETTVMPPIPGLCGLLSMLFCQKLELRVDEEYTTYTGCVTGLGVDPKLECIYHDHDMEIVFDTEIDADDIFTINSIRSSLNSILSDTVSYEAITSLRNSMRVEAIRLLERERKPMEEIWPEEIHKWNVISTDRLQSSQQLERDSGAVFPLHRPVILTKRPDGEEQKPVSRNTFFHFFGDNVTTTANEPQG